MDQSSVLDTLESGTDRRFVSALLSPTLVGVMQQTLPMFLCPSDAQPALNADRPMVTGTGEVLVATSNLVGSQGTLNDSRLASRGHDGALKLSPKNRGVKFQQISDGLSKTFLLGERASRAASGSTRGWAGVWCGATASRPDEGSGTDSAMGVFGCTRVSLNEGRLLFGATGTAPTVGYTSLHGGMSQFAFCDGSVRAIDETIDSRVGDVNDYSTFGVYQRLSAIADGQPTEDW